MARSVDVKTRSILAFAALAVITAAAVATLLTRVRTAAATIDVQDAMIETGLPNYDIRFDRSSDSKLDTLRSSYGVTHGKIGQARSKIAAAEEALRRKILTLQVLYSDDLGVPEVIAPDVDLGRNVLTAPSGEGRVETLKNFLRENADLIGARSTQIADLKVRADYANPSGNLSFVELTQELDGIPVFRGAVKAAFTRKGEMVRVINGLATGADDGPVSTYFGDARISAQAAVSSISSDIELPYATTPLGEAIVFGTGDFATSAERTYFPIDVGVLVPAWQVLIWQPRHSYYVVVDATTQTILWRKNITDDQKQPATYSVFANPNAMVNLARSPFPLSPGTLSPNGIQAQPIQRTLITRIGNEPPYTFNDLGWLTDGSNSTDGNNVQAGLDRELPNSGAPANPNDIDPNGMAVGSPSRVFSFNANPSRPSNPALGEGDNPLPPGESPTVCRQPGMSPPITEFQKASVSNLFYIVNVFHDEMYRLGFTEAAGNFQHENFDRGGLGGDRVSAQAQDCTGTNNATFSTPTDGMRPQMQVQLWTAPAPDVDGSFDSELIIHESAHGVSQRLHGNSLGLFIDFSRGMGEGWSDFYAQCMLSGPDEPIQGVYPTLSYSTYRHTNAGFNNYYYGIRRFPMAVMSFTGGPQNRPHNPLTFADIDSMTMDLSDGAFAPNFVNNADQVHSIGEVWSAALWEVRARFITRLGWAEGNRRVLQLVTDGMKMSPISPNFITGRDAIVAAAQAAGTAEDVADVWAGFAIRGIGAGASVQNSGATSTGGTNTIRVTQAFDLPNLRQSPEITISDETGDNDGYAEPGETLRVRIPLANITGRTATDISLDLAGGDSAVYGDLVSGQTKTRDLVFTVPAAASCGNTLTLTLNVNSSLGPTTFTRQIYIGKGLSMVSSQDFDGVPAPNLPSGWTATNVGAAANFVTSTNDPDSPPNSVFAANPSTVGGGTDLTSPPIDVTRSNATLSFRHKFATEAGWDGGVLEISIDGAPYRDITAMFGWFSQGNYNGMLGPGVNNPLAGRVAWTGDSGGYQTTVVNLPASTRNKIIRLRWRFGADDNTAVKGWNVDTVTLAGAGFVTNFACALAPDLRSRADFDGDGRTDASVFRPQDGNWWQNRSTQGVTAQVWGLSGDIPVPGDYDGDGKADLAVFRGRIPVGEPDLYVFNSHTSTVTTLSWGLPGDIPVVGDFDGDRRSDHSVWRPSNGVWYVQFSAGGFRVLSLGTNGDLPVGLDIDGDGAANFAIYRPSEGRWYVLRPASAGPETIDFGLPGDRPVPADYDGDDKDDVAVFRPDEGRWYIHSSVSSSTYAVTFGQAGDIPVPGDYDGDGRDDQAVYRQGTWFLNMSSNGVIVIPFGTQTDIPIPAKYLP